MLELTVFISGALVMVLEMAGGRILAPHVGTSAVVWASLIGIIMAFMAAGAWAGGKFADKKLSKSGLAQALCGAAAGCALTALCHTSIGQSITSIVHNIYIAAVISAILIFALPSFFFGMITPYVIRLRLATLNTAGATVGRLYALATAGSILGTFLGGFILISFFSNTIILWGVSVSMLLLSLLNCKQKPWLRLLFLIVLIFLCQQDIGYADWLSQKTGVYLIESPYNTISIIDGVNSNNKNVRVRLMRTGPDFAQSGMLIDEPNELYFDYSRFYMYGPEIVPNAKSILMLGGGGYSVPKWLISPKSPLANIPDLKITVVELDPAMTKASYKYFALPKDKRLNILHEDARLFLNNIQEKYDLLFVDVFNSACSIPFQMGTAEAIKGMKKALNPEGALLMNIISAIEGDDGRLFQSIYHNIASEFKNVRVYCVGKPDRPDKMQNLMVIASDKELSEAAIKSQELQKFEKNLYTKQIPKSTPPLYDDFAPVERYSLMLIKD